MGRIQSYIHIYTELSIFEIVDCNEYCTLFITFMYIHCTYLHFTYVVSAQFEIRILDRLRKSEKEFRFFREFALHTRGDRERLLSIKLYRVKAFSTAVLKITQTSKNVLHKFGLRLLLLQF